MDANTAVSAHFRLGEFKCKCGCGLLPNPASPAFQRLVLGLEKYREKLLHGKPFKINSGIRCAAKNASLSQSATNSYHLAKNYCAVDPVGLFTFEQVKGLHVFGGIGWDKATGKVTHVDVRPGSVTTPVTWSYPWK